MLVKYILFFLYIKMYYKTNVSFSQSFPHYDRLLKKVPNPIYIESTGFGSTTPISFLHTNQRFLNLKTALVQLLAWQITPNKPTSLQPLSGLHTRYTKAIDTMYSSQFLQTYCQSVSFKLPFATCTDRPSFVFGQESGHEFVPGNSDLKQETMAISEFDN